MYVRNDIYIKRLKNLEVPYLSVLWVLVDTGATQNVYVGVYRSHSGDPEIARLFGHFSEVADEAQQRNPAAQLFVLIASMLITKSGCSHTRRLTTLGERRANFHYR